MKLCCGENLLHFSEEIAVYYCLNMHQCQLTVGSAEMRLFYVNQRHILLSYFSTKRLQVPSISASCCRHLCRHLSKPCPDISPPLECKASSYECFAPSGSKNFVYFGPGQKKISLSPFNFCTLLSWSHLRVTSQ